MESESQKIENTEEEIKDALTCFICTAKVMDPLMCHQCKKMVCSKCIKKWFEEGHDKCPYCQVQTNLDKMVSLPFMNQLSEYFIKEIDNKKEIKEERRRFKGKGNNVLIDEDYNSDSNINNENENFEIDEDCNLSKTHLFPNKFNKIEESINNENKHRSNIKRGEFCPKHNEKIEYYCLNCDTKHCSKCLLFFSVDSKIHQGHKVVSLEQKNKYNLEEVKKEINNLVNVVDEINTNQTNIDVEIQILEKKEEFINKVIEEFKDFFYRKIKMKKENLELKSSLNKNHLEKISKIKNSYTESLNNFIERNDENGFKEYQQRIKDLQNINFIQQNVELNNYFNPNLKIYETDFIDMDINEYEEIIGDIYFNVEGMDNQNQLHLRLNGEAIDEVLINLQIELENDLQEAKDNFFGFLLFKNNNHITPISIDEKMIHDKILIMGKTIIKSSLRTVVSNNKCHIKLILANFTI
jgi:hypothetical protein